MLDNGLLKSSFTLDCLSYGYNNHHSILATSGSHRGLLRRSVPPTGAVAAVLLTIPIGTCVFILRHRHSVD